MKHRLAMWLLPRLYKVAMVLILASCRIRFVGRDGVERLAASGQPWIDASRVAGTLPAISRCFL